MPKNYDISARRKQLGLTLEEVGNRVGVSKSTVKKWETGYIENMKRDKIALLAQVLEISPLELMDVEIEVKPAKPFLTSSEQHLIKAYRTLNDEGKSLLLSYTDFLADKYSDSPSNIFSLAAEEKISSEPIVEDDIKHT